MGSLDTTSALVRRHERALLDRVAARQGQTTIVIADAFAHERLLLRSMRFRLGV